MQPSFLSESLELQRNNLGGPIPENIGDMNNLGK